MENFIILSSKTGDSGRHLLCFSCCKFPPLLCSIAKAKNLVKRSMLDKISNKQLGWSSFLTASSLQLVPSTFHFYFSLHNKMHSQVKNDCCRLMIAPIQAAFASSKSTRIHQNKVWNLFRVNNRDIRTTSITSFWCLYELWADLIHCSGVSIVDLEQVNAVWVGSIATNHEEHSEVLIFILTKSLCQMNFC